MKFNPCIDQCTNDGSHCQGCGRAHEEIATTKKLVMALIEFIEDQDYENPEEFMDAVRKSVLKKLQKRKEQD